MKSLSILALVALLPVVGAGGYALHRAPAPPDPSVQAVLAAKLKQASTGDSYYFVVTKGKYKGDVNDAATILLLYPTEKALHDHGAPPHRWVKAHCVTYNTTGSQYSSLERESVQHCTVKTVTRAQVLKAVKAAASVGAIGHMVAPA